jgi:threonine-phosphate decarboxylase
VRLGYLVSSDAAVLEALGRVMQPWSVSAFAQAAGVAALKDAAGFIERSVSYVSGERAFLSSGLSELGFEVFPSDTNFILTRLEGAAQARDALAARGILARDCSNFHGLDGDWLRFAVRRREENALLLSALAEILERAVNA